ncbi:MULTISPECIES: SufE family protein [Halobacteriovorax]|uniref:SufE family protein n=1 Tax=Halobacteriovorax vibrionivorans TaxID=2152716 RepID=A0ABY0ID46_9BACT|nr:MULTISPECIES: SufE family protein [Halobacteriovorax]AYF44335.1 Fe-S metabolism associated domain protein [Halobacteriovorax sp. BALOs_7]RZF20420.1 SufE family protein [Halobacteriovorax vibrionivorans]TGD46593.1 SufE family protein [Halobacteriovorax sp. Y22]
MQIQERVDALVEEFNKFNDWEDRYMHIISMGKKMPALPEELYKEEYKVKGCQSQVWLIPELKDGKVIFQADSDAAIVKGIVSILIGIYSDATPDEILATKPDFLDTIGLRQHLSMSRANGLSSMIKQISMYALAYKTKLQMGL